MPSVRDLGELEPYLGRRATLHLHFARLRAAARRATLSPRPTPLSRIPVGGLCLKQSPTTPAARRPNESAIPCRPAHLRETHKPGAGKHFAIFRTATFPQVARSVRLDRAAVCFGGAQPHGLHAHPPRLPRQREQPGARAVEAGAPEVLPADGSHVGRRGSYRTAPGYRLAIHRTASFAVTVADANAAQRSEHGAGSADHGMTGTPSVRSRRPNGRAWTRRRPHSHFPRRCDPRSSWRSSGSFGGRCHRCVPSASFPKAFRRSSADRTWCGRAV